MPLNQFARDVKEGLSSSPKRLSSKYFYDARGDKLFQQIMHLDEYYLSRAELEIFQTHKEALLEIMDHGAPFRLVELGAGDGLKTKVLLKHFLEQGVDFSYAPVDISPDVLEHLQSNLLKEIPDLKIEPLAGDYFRVLADLKFKNHTHSVAFFLGSNIGNFLSDTAINFLSSIHDNLQQGDYLMIGFDLKKDPKRILNAYNDAAGVTRAFNMNLLDRINRELDANFDTSMFDHNPIYDPMTGQCRSYLISKQPLEVHVGALNETFSFREWEPIFMEVSKKYDLEEIEELAVKTGFRLVQNFFDQEHLFCDSVWEVI